MATTQIILDPALMASVPEGLARTHRVIPLRRTDTTLVLGMEDPSDVRTLDFIRRKTGLEIAVETINRETIEELLRQYHPTLESEVAAIVTPEIDPGSPTLDPRELERAAREIPIIRIVDTIIEHAIRERASDIHIEPEEEGVSVRYRIDGVLKPVMTLPKNSSLGIVARIKILAALKLDEHRLPQDGRFRIMLPERTTFRVSIIPVMTGEKVELRLLPEETTHHTLEGLGLATSELERIQRAIRRPHGIILSTGPTGSGKTTTLYAILATLNKPQVNIVTIEDPIEYRLPHANQSQVNPRIGYTFATALRAFLRQDPNIMMVGEIRDEETADIATHAALTGHLVLSTLHTNDAPTAIPRLVEMKVPPFLVASTVRCVIAQRLVRTLCESCKKPWTIESKDWASFAQSVNLKDLETGLLAQGILKNGETLAGQKAWLGQGCAECENSGLRGRIGLYEVLTVTPEISQMILHGATADELRVIARKEGMMTMLEDGFAKVLAGVTTIEEVLRVTRE